MKWGKVQEFVASKVSEEAARVRRRLEEATIMIVDPAAFLRTLDLQNLTGRATLPYLSREVARDPRFAPLRRFLADRVGRVLLIDSGAESVYALLTSPLVGESLTLGRELRSLRSEHRQLDPFEIAKRTTGLNKIARIALQTSALVAHEHDPEQHVAIGRYVDGGRWGTGIGEFNQARLEALARRSIVYDRGHEDSTSIAADLHRAARKRLENSPFSLASAGDYAFPVGDVRTGSTSDEVELQMADVAAGFARQILSEQGALALAKSFRVVLYNGRLLRLADAEKLDTESRFHRRLIDRAG